MVYFYQALGVPNLYVKPNFGLLLVSNIKNPNDDSEVQLPKKVPTRLDLIQRNILIFEVNITNCLTFKTDDVTKCCFFF